MTIDGLLGRGGMETSTRDLEYWRIRMIKKSQRVAGSVNRYLRTDECNTMYSQRRDNKEM
jgi:hypothetical protein